jgi:RimJ/RimL family protein N-acetyltransferase
MGTLDRTTVRHLPLATPVPTGPAVATVWFHRAGPDDEADLHALYERMTPESRRRRFFQPMPRVHRSIARHLSHVDPEVHLVWLARLGGLDGPVVGEVQIAREADAPHRGELAIAVDDAWAGRGLGRHLVAVIHAAAARQGITEVTAEVLAENRASLHLLTTSGMRFGFAGGALTGTGPVRGAASIPTSATIPVERADHLTRSA